jgi:hypothetical protein
VWTCSEQGFVLCASDAVHGLVRLGRQIYSIAFYSPVWHLKTGLVHGTIVQGFPSSFAAKGSCPRERDDVISLSSGPSSPLGFDCPLNH